MTIEWKLQKFKTKDLKGLTKNPRRLTKDQHEQLKTSLDKFGLIDKPVVTQDGTIIGGHQRIKILKAAGEKEIECNVPVNDLSKKDIDELNIRLNKNEGEWDDDILANQWDIDDLVDWGFTLKELGMDPDDLLKEACEKDNPKKAIVTVTFENMSEMEHACEVFDEIIHKYDSATYKVKIK